MTERPRDEGGSPSRAGGGAADPVNEVLRRLAARRPRESRYRRNREIARGGMGSIVEVFDEDIRRPLAMKVILDPGRAQPRGDAEGASSAQDARFLEEAKITAQLDHPGIVPVHELGLDSDGRLFFTMKLVKGRDLEAVFDLVFGGKEDWTETRALGVLLRVCEAMAYAHAKGVIHRDLKPSNVMVGSFGEAYVMDWGLARALGRRDKHDLRLKPGDAEKRPAAAGRRAERSRAADSPIVTIDGDVVGTPAYMPPEQARGEVETLGPAADVYAIGAMLYHLLARRRPYVPKGARLTDRTVLARVVEGPPEPLRKVRPAVPAELASIVEKAMAREPDRRYATTHELSNDLRAYLEHRVVKAYATGAVAELRKWVERNKGVAATVAASLLALVAAVVLVNDARMRADRSAEEASRQEAIARENERLAKNEERIASASAEEASREREHVLRLSDLERLRDLETDAARLWPAHPENAAGIEAWLDRAKALAGRLPDHRRRLAALRESALPRNDGDGRTWRFETPEAEWQHGLLQRLVAGVEDLERDDREWSAVTIAALERRLEFASSVGRRTIDEARARWDEAIAGIRSPEGVYGGLEIVPQVGLVPIGKDPECGLYEFWHVQSGDEPLRDERGRIVPSAGMGVVLVLVPGGTFRMGSPDSEPGRQPHEGPRHDVTLGAYFLSKYEMTQAQWQRFAGSNPSAYQSGFVGDRAMGPLHPVELVSGEDCERVLSRLGLVLPSEAEWERAARGGTETAWWTGADRESLRGKANVADQAAARSGVSWPDIADWPDLDDGHAVHAAIGSFDANPYGLHDMTGNVWEWCRDAYGDYRSPVSPIGGDRQVASPRHAVRVIRGGGFDYSASHARSAARNSSAPELRGSDLGFRPARRLAPN